MTMENGSSSIAEEKIRHSVAWIAVDKTDLAQIVEGAQAIVYWRMMLLNESDLEEV